jgi:phage terminase small subunit
MDMSTSGSQVDSRLFEQPLNDKERALRDLFVNEYLKDFDAYRACIRVGFISTFAIDWAKRFMSEGYVLRAIEHFTRKPAEDEAAQAAADKVLIENTLREVARTGTAPARVAAVSKLAEMRGLTKPDASADAEQSLIDLFKDFSQKAPA